MGSGRVDQLAKRSTLAEEKERDLWIWELTQTSEKPACFVYLVLCVCIAKLISAYGSSKELETAIAFESKVRREELLIYGVPLRSGDDLTLFPVEL